MATEAQLQNAENVFQSICTMLNNINFKYEAGRRDEDYVVQVTVNGDDIPMKMLIIVRPEREIVSLLSPMPFNTPEDKRVEMALAVATANYGIIDGSFDYDLNDGEIRFRLTASYIESLLGEELFKYMLFVSANTVDRYNDRFLAVAKGIMTLEQFIEADKN